MPPTQIKSTNSVRGFWTIRISIAAFIALLCYPMECYAKQVRDTLVTVGGKDKVIISYDFTTEGNIVRIKFNNKPRIIPSDELRKESKGDIDRIKAVVFDKVTDSKQVKWKGLTPTAFTVPAGVSYVKSVEGYNIIGEGEDMEFIIQDNKQPSINLPVYIALYEKKGNYKLLNYTRNPLTIKPEVADNSSQNKKPGVTSQQIEIQTSEDSEMQDADIEKALSSIYMINQLLAEEKELPFSQTLQMEIYTLRGLKEKIRDKDITEKINEVLLQYNDKERELKELQKDKETQEKLQTEAQLQTQKEEEERLRQEMEEQARDREERQQKQTLWIIIGGVILAVVAFISNAVLKHFRNISNQKKIQEMQDSLAREAQGAATRRAREIARNKTHRMVNEGKNKMRESVKTSINSSNKKDIRSI